MKTEPHSRPEPLTVTTAAGISFIFPPVTRGQLRAALALDARDVQSDAWQLRVRRRQQLAGLLGETLQTTAKPLRVQTEAMLATLTAREEEGLFAAILDQSSSPEDPTRRPAKRPPLTAAQRLANFDADTLALSLFLHRTPSEVESSVGFCESLTLLEAIFEERRAEARFEAALHNKELRSS
jgi:hypothetical protein